MISFWLSSVLLFATNTGHEISLVEIIECADVRVLLEDPEQLEWGTRVAESCCREFDRLKRSMKGQSLEKIQVRITKDMESYAKRSGQPWFIVATLVLDEIVTQPVSSLRKLEDLQATLGHEMIHLWVRELSAHNCPRWLDEGLAQWVSGQKRTLPAEAQLAIVRKEKDLEELDKRLEKPLTMEQSRTDYALARQLTARLIKQTGLEPLIRALPKLKSLKDPLELPVLEISLRQRLVAPLTTPLEKPPMQMKLDK